MIPDTAPGVTGNAREVIRVTNDPIPEYAPEISPDGKKILFTSTIGSTSQICMMDTNGNNFTVLTEGTLPSYHPKGTSFLYQKPVGKFNQIFTYNLKTGQSTQLTSGDSGNSQAAYSPNGNTIVFTSGRDNTSSHIFTMAADGSTLTQITTGNSVNFAPTFGTNDMIYFCSNAGAPKVNGFALTASAYSDIWSVKLIK